MIHKIALFTAAVVLTLVAGLTPRAFAQSYEKTHASSITLAGSGTNTSNTLTLIAGSLSGATTLTFPDGNTAGILLDNGSGGLTWVTTLSGLTINNSTIGGTSSINTSGLIKGGAGSFATLSDTGSASLDALGSGGTVNIGNAAGPSTTTIYGNLSLPGTVTYTTTPSIPLATNDIFTGQSNVATALAPTANAVLITGGLTPFQTPQWATTLPTGLTISGETMNNETIGGTTSINTSGSITGGAGSFTTLTASGTTSLDASPSSGGTVSIGNAAGPSTTTIYGTLSLPGTVTFTSAPSIPLPTNDIFTGQSNVATALGPTANAVLITGGTSPFQTPQWATTLPTGLTLNNETIGGTTTINTSGLIKGGAGSFATLSDTGNASLDALGSGGTVTIGNSAGPSTTTINGTVNFTGTVTLPSGTTATNFSGSLLGDVTGTQSATVISNTGAAGTTAGTHIVSAINLSSTTGAIDLANGGTGANLTAAKGGIFYSGASAGAISANTATADQVLLSGASGGTGTPTWSSETFPTSTIINQILYSNATNTVTGLPTANGGILNTTSGGVPSITATPTLGVAATTTGTLAFAASGTGNTGTSSISAGAEGANTMNYILPLNSGGVNEVLTEDTISGNTVKLQWAAPAASPASVLYNDSTGLNASATVGTTNYLFDVGYASTAKTNAALGARITSNNTATSGTALQHSAVGLTINTTATGTGAAQGIPVGLAITISGDTNGPAIVLHNASTPVSGDSVHNIIESADNSLDIEQTGDLYGSSIVHMQNRTGANGAIFQTISSATHDSTDVVDWGFIPGHGVQSNIRLEARHQWATVSPSHAQNEYLRSSANVTAAVPEEFQYFFGTTGAAPLYTLSIGENATMLERGNFGIGYGTSSAGDTAAGSPRERLDVHSPGTYYGGLSDVGYKGASNIILSDSGTATHTAPYIGAMEFQGANDGLSTFAAGSQGSNYINYTLPTVTTAPTANQVLTISSISGTGTSVSPYTAALTWSNSGGEVFGHSASNTNITSTSLSVYDASLELALVANATYEFSGVIAYDGGGTGGTTSSNLNIAMHFATGTLTSMRWSANQPGTAVSPSSVTTDGTAITSFHVDPVMATNDQSIFVSGIIVVGATGGTLEVEEALNSAAGNTEILSNSFIRATRVQ